MSISTRCRGSNLELNAKLFRQNWVMKTLSLVIAAGFLVFGAAVSQAVTSGNTKVLNRISTETGVPVDTLQTQKEATGFGYGELENANLLANASGQSFDTIVAKRQAGEGWGQIAHDYGLNLGKVVSAAHRSDQATMHSQSSVHGQSGMTHGKSTHANAGTDVSVKSNGKRGRGAAQAKVHGHGHGP
jgi:hypothetical protein